MKEDTYLATGWRLWIEEDANRILFEPQRLGYELHELAVHRPELLKAANESLFKAGDVLLVGPLGGQESEQDNDMQDQQILT